MITAVRYAAITGDETTASALVEDAVAEATVMLEEYLDRPLAHGEHTETLHPDRKRRLWPRATPITDGGDYEVDGLALLGAGWGFGTDPLGIGGDGSTGVTVTYSGGWTAETLPMCIQRDLAYAAYRLLHPRSLAAPTGVPEGATSVRLGDAAVTYGDGGAGAVATDATDTWWSKRTRSYRYAPIGGST